jgi:hypothetical protein
MLNENAVNGTIQPNMDVNQQFSFPKEVLEWHHYYNISMDFLQNHGLRMGRHLS